MLENYLSAVARVIHVAIPKRVADVKDEIYGAAWLPDRTAGPDRRPLRPATGPPAGSPGRLPGRQSVRLCGLASDSWVVLAWTATRPLAGHDRAAQQQLAAPYSPRFPAIQCPR